MSAFATGKRLMQSPGPSQVVGVKLTLTGNCSTSVVDPFQTSIVRSSVSARLSKLTLMVSSSWRRRTGASQGRIRLANSWPNLRARNAPEPAIPLPYAARAGG